ncbi:uncharacterized protein LOC129593311 [Paramacrobiotus metropolitanus]|uniref:uncharacterized protein LOC129593311 n=1 Tax=Paramacrobiotus metropolitanus TaxID=2943436 RepID=UPI00244653BC|nr:uncharacterized protein LOC129593311 [Paramacrobiotus metropolitanus]
MGCDFPGNDLGQAAMPGERCGGHCASNPACTHFAWSNWNGGVCTLKGGSISKANAINSGDTSTVCGVIRENPENSGGQPSGSNRVFDVLATRHAAHESGSCELPSASYTVQWPVRLGDIGSLQDLKYSPGMCGQVLNIDCRSGALDTIVNNANLGGGLDLYASTWDRATDSKPPGESRCSVILSTRNAMDANGPQCFYAPTSEKNNAFFKLLGVFNTNGQVGVSASLDGRPGSFNGLQPYFAFHGGPIDSGAQAVFRFSDGSTFSTSLRDCIAQSGVQMWS